MRRDEKPDKQPALSEDQEYGQRGVRPCQVNKKYRPDMQGKQRRDYPDKQDQADGSLPRF